MSFVDYSILTKTKPEKGLSFGLNKRAGRAMHGRITVRHRGGGEKRKYRVIDFKRKKIDVFAKVISLEYDPNRTCFIALINYKDGEKSYILAPQDLKVGDEVVSSYNAPLKPGNRLPLKNIPVGTFVYNVELFPGRGGQIIRSAGNFGEILAKEGKFVNLRMPSTEIRRVFQDSFASIGSLSNSEHRLVKIGKAGRMRKMGRRPVVRGSAMNPRDHPHGGGEGKAPIGLKYPKTKWGKHAFGVKTRKRKKWSNKLIIQRRKK